MSVTSSLSGSSAAVSTQITPGKARAREASSRRMRAEGCGLRSTLACSMLGMEKSPAYCVAPTAFPSASTLRTGWPTWRSGGSSTGGSGLI